MAYLEELLPEFRKGEVRRDEVNFYEDRKMSKIFTFAFILS